jgi:hypothetical protein
MRRWPLEASATTPPLSLTIITALRTRDATRAAANPSQAATARSIRVIEHKNAFAPLPDLAPGATATQHLTQSTRHILSLDLTLSPLPARGDALRLNQLPKIVQEAYCAGRRAHVRSVPSLPGGSELGLESNLENSKFKMNELPSL